MLWRPSSPFRTAHVYPPGHSPREHHPPQWGKLELQRYGELGPSRLRAVVRSTRRRGDGWSFNVVELEQYPGWISYFHFRNERGQSRIQCQRSSDPIAGQLAQAFELYNYL